MRIYTLTKCSDCPDHLTAHSRICIHPQNKWGIVHITDKTEMVDGFPSWCPLRVVDDAS